MVFTSTPLIRPKCITILYCNLTLFIDIFHFKVLFLCCFGLFYTFCNFPVPKQQKQNSAVKSGHQVAVSQPKVRYVLGSKSPCIMLKKFKRNQLKSNSNSN